MKDGSSKISWREILQSGGTFAALFISVLALVVSIYEASLLKVQQRAMVWPYLRIDEKYNSEGFGLTISNNGTGPAIISSVEMKYKDDFVKNYEELAALMFPEQDVGYDIINTNIINQTVIRNGERRSLFFIPWNEKIRKEFESLQIIKIKIGYHSVLNENWVYNYPSGLRLQEGFRSSLEFKN